MAVSPVYETVPVGGPPQPDYLNAVLLARTALPSRDAARPAARDRGRVRPGALRCAGGRAHWTSTSSPSPASVSDDPDLTLPHPRAHERAFVLAPWHDVDPDAELPGYGPVAALLAAADRSGIRRNGTVRA